jgi:membrane protein
VKVGDGFGLLKDAFKEWREDKADRLAASLAYYTIFSLAPLVLIAIAIAGLVFGREAAQGQIFGQLQGLLGPEAAGTIEASVANSQKKEAGLFSAGIGLVVLLWSASNVFGQLQDALNTIWEVAPKPGAGIKAFIQKRVLSMGMVLAIGFLLLVSLVLSAGLSAVGNFLGGLLPGGEALWQVVNFVVSFGIVTALFAAIYKVLPDAEVQWSDVWVGAAVTALLFVIGKLLIGLYLGHASVGSTFGAAGSLVVLLVWVYYSAQILFFGAEFTQAYARRFGSRIEPSEGAVKVTEGARANQGIPHKEQVERLARPARGRGAPAESVEQEQELKPLPFRGSATATESNGNGR